MTSSTVSVPDGDGKENHPRFRKSPHPTKQTPQQQPRLDSRDISSGHGWAHGALLGGAKGDYKSNGVSSKENVMALDAVDSPPAKKLAVVSRTQRSSLWRGANWKHRRRIALILIAVCFASSLQATMSVAAGDLTKNMDAVDEEALNDKGGRVNDADSLSSPNKGEEDEAEAAWKIIAEMILTEPVDAPHRQRLEVLLQGMQRSEAAQEALEKAYVVFQAALDASLEKVLMVAVPVHSHFYNKIVLAERDLLHHFVSNHTTRQAIFQTLQDHNDQWQRKYEGFFSRILPGQDESNAVLGNYIQDKLATDDSSKYLKVDTVTVANANKDLAHGGGGGEIEGEEDDAIPDPDWDALLELDPSSRDKVQLFLEGRDRWQTACQRFSTALDEIHEQLKQSHANMLQTIAQAYIRICDDLDKQESDIKTHIVSNFQRRHELEMVLEEAAKQQQNIFTQLMARVGGGGGGMSATNMNASQQHTKKSKGGILPLSHIFHRGGKKRKQP